MLKTNKIINLTTNLIVPFIIIYSLYIQANGEVSPGGGFQAGAILASCIIAVDLAMNEKILAEMMYRRHLLHISNIGIAIYALTGLACMLLGANYLDYNILKINSLAGQQLGICIIEIGVGLCVASTLCLIYVEFSKL